MTTGRRHSRMGASLFAIYAVASLVPVALLGVVLTRGYHDAGVRHALDQGRAQAAVIEEMAIAPALGGADLSERPDRSERSGCRPPPTWRSSTAPSPGCGCAASPARRLLRRRHVRRRGAGEDPAFQAPPRTVDVRLVEAGAQAPTAIRVLQPVVAASNGQAIGVLEVYLPYERDRRRVEADTRRTIGGSAAASSPSTPCWR